MSRRPAVAGTFYPARAKTLAATVDALLDTAGRGSERGGLRALVVPHAGYACSGPTAATAYVLLDRTVRTLVLIGPAHRGQVPGLAVPETTTWTTPLGEVAIDDALCRMLEAGGHAVRDDHPHLGEHSLEVQLPFLQRVLPAGWTCLPIAVGPGDPERVADALDALTGTADVMVVASTDLSHYHQEATAHRLDGRTCQAVLDRDPAAIGYGDACGADALRGLLAWAGRHDHGIDLLHRSTSADTCSDARRVVGYAAFAVTGPARSSG